MASKKHRSLTRRSAQSGDRNSAVVNKSGSKPEGAGKGKQARSNGSKQSNSSFERYTAMAEAAAAAGNAVDAEYYYQHAEHYYRLMKLKAA